MHSLEPAVKNRVVGRCVQVKKIPKRRKKAHGDECIATGTFREFAERPIVLTR
jgi:hypothetical protein